MLFLKHVLYHAAKSRDVARVVLLAAPKINSVEVGKQLAQQTGQVLITGQYIMNCFKKVGKHNVCTYIIYVWFTTAPRYSNTVKKSVEKSIQNP